MGLFSRLLGGKPNSSRGCICKACGKPLRPFVETASASPLDQPLLPRIEQDHVFVCERCHNAVCPVCSGRRGGELGLRQFVCTTCGHTPLETLHR
jgi:hypothetical protein